MAKYQKRIYKTGYFRGGSDIYPNLITFEDNIVIPLIVKSYVFHWYHAYLL